MATLAGVLVPVVTTRWKRDPVRQSAIATIRNRAFMLRRVRRTWVNELPGDSRIRPIRLNLGLMRRPDMLPPSRTEWAGHESALIPMGTAAVQIFDETAGGLLILGDAGAGKTTWLLELARELIVRAEANADQPMPVVLNLTSWANARQQLDDWLADEIVVSYDVPKQIAQAWIQQDELTLLLDGLDEVAEDQQSPCVAAINEYRRKHGLVGIAVCVRTRRLRALRVTPDFDEAVELLSLTDADVAAYLDQMEVAGAQLGDLRSAITADQALRDLMRSPLMLQVIARLPTQAGDHADQRMWAAYMSQMLNGHAPKNAVRKLAWLAGALQDHNQTEFHLDRLTAGWLPSWHRRWFVRRGIALARYTASDISPVEDLHLAWKSLGWALFMLLPFSLLLGLILGLIAGAPIRGLAFGAEMGILCALDWTRKEGLVPALRDARSTPNEGIRRSAANGLLLGLSVGLLTGLSSGFVFTLVGSRLVGLAFGISIGVFFGFTSGLDAGGKACLQHYIVRGALVLTGCTPWRYTPFLNKMTERLLLDRNGSGYRFAHQLLRDYLAQHGAGTPPMEKIK
jgi:hypothetical protein